MNEIGGENRRRKPAKKIGEENKRRKQAKITSEDNKRRKAIENEKRIVDFLKKEGSASNSKIAEVIGLSVPRTRVILSGMTTIDAYGNTTNRRYRLKEGV